MVVVVVDGAVGGEGPLVVVLLVVVGVGVMVDEDDVAVVGRTLGATAARSSSSSAGGSWAGEPGCGDHGGGPAVMVVAAPLKADHGEDVKHTCSRA